MLKQEEAEKTFSTESRAAPPPRRLWTAGDTCPFLPSPRTGDHFKPSFRASEEIQTRAKKRPRGHRYPCYCAVDIRFSTYQKIEFRRR